MVGLEFEVLPESSLKCNDVIEFVLGTPINQVITALQNASKVIRNVEFVYSKEEPFTRDLTITLKNDGIRLIIEPVFQRLKLIEVYDFKNITLKYCETIFSSPDEEANVDKIEKCFGATHPGVYDEKQKMYLLKWRGVAFCFPAKDSSSVQSTYAHGLGSLHFANSELPFLQRMIIFSGSNPSEPKLPEIPLAAYCGNNHLISVTSVEEYGRITGVKYAFVSEDVSPTSNRKPTEPPRFEKIIRLGDTEQSVLAALGAPSKIFYKSDEKMLIQRGPNQVKIDDKPDMFFNYFTMGSDILIDNVTRRVKKFILHTNIPGHYDFGIYSKCIFEINIPGTNYCIQTDSKLESYREIFATTNGHDDEKFVSPVILNKNSTNGGDAFFGATFCYGREQLIVEVTDTSFLATVVIYQDEREGSSETE
jgi:hypothetical protein